MWGQEDGYDGPGGVKLKLMYRNFYLFMYRKFDHLMKTDWIKQKERKGNRRGKTIDLLDFNVQADVASFER